MGESEWSYGRYTMNPGTGYTIYYWFNGDDVGASFAAPREYSGSTRSNQLRVTDYGSFRYSDGKMSYFITVVNDGPQVATFELVGVNCS